MKSKNNKKISSFVVCALATNLFAATSTFAVSQMNPYANANGFINPDYAQEVNAFFNRNPTYKNKATQLNLLDGQGQWRIPTAIWLDSTAAIEGETARGTHGVNYYLNEALKKASDNKPIVITFVIYDLPLRDCDAYSSNGEFKKPEDLNQYKTNYIDKINNILNNFYLQKNSQNVRTVLIIEPDSLPNLITNANKGLCQIAAEKKVYVDGINYALTQFSHNQQNNVYLYLDIAHSGWLGWATNMNKVADIYNNQVLGTGFNNVRGFITNTANYTPLQEAFSYDQYLPNYAQPQVSKWIMLTKYYSWNEAYDERSYVAEIMSLQSNGKLQQADNHRILKPADMKYAGKYFLIDTSRNGWLTNNTDYRALDNQNREVSYARKDQRHHRGNWCNIQNILPTVTNYDNQENKLVPFKPTSTGFGDLPQENPTLFNPFYKNSSGADIQLPIDAYVWIKPPGESDGSFDSQTNTGDQMCGDNNGGDHDDSQRTDSLQSGNQPAPKAGYFFDDAFKNLIDVRGCLDGKFNSRFCS